MCGWERKRHCMCIVDATRTCNVLPPADYVTTFLVLTVRVIGETRNVHPQNACHLYIPIIIQHILLILIHLKSYQRVIVLSFSNVNPSLPNKCTIILFSLSMKKI